MEVFLFVFVLFVLAVAVGGGVVWAMAGHLRRKKLDPAGDQVEPGTEQEPATRPPLHHQVESEQRTHFAGTR